MSVLKSESPELYIRQVIKLISEKVFGSIGWPEWLGGILLGLLNIYFLALANKPFTIYGGFETWGRSLYSTLNIMSMKEAILRNKTSLGDIGLFSGALITAIVAKEFKIKRSRATEYIEGLVGGFLMALGVTLSWGCNWGGFFSAIIPLSLHGYGMFIGLIIGGYLGQKYVRWRASRMINTEIQLDSGPYRRHKSIGIFPWQLTLFLAGLFVGLTSLSVYLFSGGTYLAMFIIGFGVGVVIQRSRFCFATAFREIFGGVEMRRAIRLQTGIALGIIVGASGAAILKYMGYINPDVYVKNLSISNVIGGIIFGFGMSIVGACASGSLWKAAEGNIKVLLALVASILSYPFLKQLRPYIIDTLHPISIYIPDLMGYGGGLLFIYLTMAIWLLVISYYAYKRGVMIYG